MLRRPLVILAGATAVGGVPRLAIAGAHLAGVAILIEKDALRQHQAGGTLDAAVQGFRQAGLGELGHAAHGRGPGGVEVDGVRRILVL